MATVERVQERDDVVALGEATLRDLIAHPPEADARHYAIRMTSGTTGRQPLMIVNEHRTGDPRSFKGFRSVILAKGTNNTRLSNALIMKEEADAPIRIIAIDEADVRPDRAALFEDLQIDAIAGFTSFVRRASDAFGEALANVRLFKFSGEKWTRTLAELFAREFPKARTYAYYISNEVGVMASTECERLPFGYYHAEDDVTFDIGMPDEDGIGDVLITKDVYRTFGVEHYRTGDLARFAQESCACGRPTFELVGRRGTDYLKVAGAVLFREEFDRVAALCADLFDDYRAVVVSGTRGAITLKVYRRDGLWSEELRERIQERFSKSLFVTASRTLAELIADGYFDPLVVEQVIEQFPHKHKEVKLSQL